MKLPIEELNLPNEVLDQLAFLYINTNHSYQTSTGSDENINKFVGRIWLGYKKEPTYPSNQIRFNEYKIYTKTGGFGTYENRRQNVGIDILYNKSEFYINNKYVYPLSYHVEMYDKDWPHLIKQIELKNIIEDIDPLDIASSRMSILYVDPEYQGDNNGIQE